MLTWDYGIKLDAILFKIASQSYTDQPMIIGCFSLWVGGLGSPALFSEVGARQTFHDLMKWNAVNPTNFIIPKTATHGFVYYKPSPNGRYMAWGLPHIVCFRLLFWVTVNLNPFAEPICWAHCHLSSLFLTSNCCKSHLLPGCLPSDALRFQSIATGFGTQYCILCLLYILSHTSWLIDNVM